MKPMSRALIVSVLAPFGIALAQDPVVIKSDIPVYELTLPAGYETTIPRESPARYVHSCGRESWAKVSATFVHHANPMKQNPSGVTAEDAFPFVVLPPDSKRSFTTLGWNNLDVGVVEYRAVVKDLPVIGISAVLPFAGNALTVTATAPDPLEKELREDFREILSRLKGKSNWRTAAELQKIQSMESVGKAAMGLVALYPIAWVLFFRGLPLRAHWFRTAWLAGTAVVLFIPITSPGDTSLYSNMIGNLILPLVFLLFAVRRVKMGIEME